MRFAGRTAKYAKAPLDVPASKQRIFGEKTNALLPHGAIRVRSTRQRLSLPRSDKVFESGSAVHFLPAATTAA
jgi:hypothetical protein